ncbi:hypothetical protein Q6D67_17800 [Haliea sp. E1-2-M8]|uniref:DUF421 domain-containing protein n=1 Tax=Haliea sp. E1-2-M8 TaxID=3064706 RepID=UPI0027293AA3|nr:hypothetical protein [Haliea sp. E1-2-M8]MDO8863557.1 hypothetical protein [Haliea sp. E1-2-M8]
MNTSEMFYQNWSALLHTVVASALSFLVLVILLRFFGKKMLLATSAGSFVIIVALGNALATAALDQSIGLAETTTGFVMLMTLQWIIIKSAARFPWLGLMMRSSAAIVFFEGKPLPEALRKQRVALEDVHAAIREKAIPRSNRLERSCSRAAAS